MTLETATLQPNAYRVTQYVGLEIKTHLVEGYGSFFASPTTWHLLTARFGRLEITAVFNNVLSVEELPAVSN